MEIIKCAENKFKSIKNEDDIMDKLYSDDSTYETIAIHSQRIPDQDPT